ncbi:apolipoprotein N-acyltransferase [Comamonadaceae bacterium PP-2]
MVASERVRRGPIGAAWRWPVALVSGLLQAAALALPGSGQSSGCLQIVGVGLAYLVLRGSATIGGAALAGWLAGASSLVATFWWLFISMHTYGGLAAPLAAAAVLALAAFLALYYGAAGALWCWLCGVGPAKGPRSGDGVQSGDGGACAAWRRIGFFALLWLGAELLRGGLWTGFPWGAGGYAHVDNPLLRPLAPWIGVYGLGAVAAALGAVAVEALCALRRRNGAQAVRVTGLGVLLLLAGPGLAWLKTQIPAWQGHDNGTLSVSLLQGNIPQDEKFEFGAGIDRSLIWYGQQLWAAQGDLIVTPETAIPLLPEQLPPDYWRYLEESVTSGGRAALVGAPLGNFEVGYTNSVVGVAPGQPAGQTVGQTYRYDKHHLVPFGEFIPPMFRWFTDLMNIPLGDFNRGPLGQPSFAWKGQRLAPNICYEDLFGEELARTFADPEQAPTVLVNMSNIGWFGNTLAVDQHLHISRMRSLEFERPMLRATNTGATAIIDHEGQVAASLEPYTVGVLQGEVTGRTGLTPYAAWTSQWGLLPLQAGVGVLLLMAVWRRRRAGRLLHSSP